MRHLIFRFQATDDPAKPIYGYNYHEITLLQEGMMDLTNLFHPGMSHEETFTVEERQLASHLGSGSIRVLATPAMIALMEKTSLDLLAQQLPSGQTSVGARVDVRHLAPTPLGMQVRIRAEILSIDGILVKFKVEAWDAQELVGEGIHLRAVIDEARFLQRVTAKSGG
jgi:fluoroacetyl-CoA thioesterase